MGKNQEVYGAELHAIYRAMLTSHAFPRTPRLEDHHLRRRPGSLTEDYIRRTRPRTTIRSRNRTTGTQPMGATKSLRPIPVDPRHRRQREGRRVGKDGSRNERGSEQLPYEFSSTSLAHLKRGITERK